MKATPKQCDSVLALFNYVEQVSGVRQAVTKNIEKSEWKLKLRDIDPKLPGIQSIYPNVQDENLLVAIAKLNVHGCPHIPSELRDWVIGNWREPTWEPQWKSPMDHYTKEMGVELESDNEIQRQQKCTYLALLEQKTTWLENREAWLKYRKTVLKSNALFDRLLALRGLVNESNLKSEAVLGNYMFRSDVRLTQNPNGACYPLVVCPLSLELNSTKDNLPLIEVRINENGQTRFQPEVIQSFSEENVDFSASKPIEDYIKEEVPSPVNSDELTDLVRKFTIQFSTDCRWREADDPFEDLASNIKFYIEEDPIILFQARPSGLKEAIESIRNKINADQDVPRHLLEIVCPDVNPEIHSEPERQPTLDEALAATAGEDNEILLTKPANTDQLSIAREIMRNNVVLVQGPPGTGKTHTIANLLGHFLAQGKRVLVTSHTPKALSVLKDKLPKEVQPLCVSMIGDKRDLERTALQLKEELAARTTLGLSSQIERLSAERHQIIERQKIVRNRIYELRFKDTKGPIYKGKEYPLTKLAELLREQEESLGHVIPGEVKQGPLPLTPSELKTLYETNGVWSEEFQRELMFDLPSLAELPTPEKMSQMNAELERLSALKKEGVETVIAESQRSDARGETYSDYVLTNNITVSVKADCKDVFSTVPSVEILERARNDAFIQNILTQCFTDPGYGRYYSQLAETLKKAEEAFRVYDKFKLGSSLTVELQSNDFIAIKNAAQWFISNAPDGKPGFFARMMNSDCKNAISVMESVRVDGRAPASTEAFSVICSEVDYRMAEAEAAQMWDKFAERANVAKWSSYGYNAVSELANNYGAVIGQAVQWCQDVWKFVKVLNEAKFKCQGLTLNSFRSGRADEMQAYVEELLYKVAAPLHAYYSVERDLANVYEWGAEISKKLSVAAQFSSTVRALEDAVLTQPEVWREYYGKLKRLIEAKPAFCERQTLINKLQAYAPDWANALLSADNEFDETTVPSNLQEAWDWKQLDLLYRERLEETTEGLQKESTELSAKLRKNTAKLVAAKAWFECKKRLEGAPALSYLTQLATFMKKAQGNGKRTAIFRREANKVLPHCQDAVPVWIMMIGDALRNFNSNGRFDIIIVDEASQADLTALPILQMGDKVIVVGDDKQVTPMAIGTNDATVENLNARYLESCVKAPKLYDARVSLYSIIQNHAFPARMLREHFRCVPEIIGYCNQLSYQGKIRPLRDRSTSKLKPAMVTYRVEDGENVNGLNRAECDAIINLLKAMINDPAYRGKTFGVISMRTGRPAQINHIKSLIMSNFDPRVVEERQLVCGGSSEFQGDERDVIILSLVDSAAPGSILNKTGDGAEESTKKRYNVAVSRARDQLWVVHSFDPDSQLKHDDIRRGLFSWISQCNAGAVDEEAVRNQADSEFEVQVAKALMERGYRLEQQHQVGPYSIDMVVRCGNDAVALECDGERYHGGDPIHGEEQIRNDMERQTVLERNGWRFIRLRGAEYFRDPEAAIERVCNDLHQLGIEPEQEEVIREDCGICERVLNAAELYAAGLEPDPVPEYEAAEEVDNKVELTESTDDEDDPDEIAEQEFFVCEKLESAIIEARFEQKIKDPEGDVEFNISRIEGDPLGGFAIYKGNRKAGEVVQNDNTVKISIRAVKGLRARGIPTAEISEDKQWRIWYIDVSELSEFLERMADYLVRAIKLY